MSRLLYGLALLVLLGLVFKIIDVAACVRSVPTILFAVMVLIVTPKYVAFLYGRVCRSCLK